MGHFLNSSQGGPFSYCRHGGWYECELQSNFLCARMLSNNSSMAQFDFAECVNDKLGFAADPGTFPQLDVKGALDDCAGASKLDTQALYACARETGPALLDASFAEGDARGIAFAPTLYINGVQLPSNKFTISVADICDAYTGSPKPAACAKPARAQATVDAALKQQQTRCRV